MSRHHVVVVGGGITGLAAAHALASAPDSPSVTVLEAAEHLGGMIRTTPFAGHAAIDEGADAFLTRVPAATELAGAVGLAALLTAPAVQRAFVWLDGLHEIPAGLLLGMPTSASGLARSKLLTWPAKLRAGLEPMLPRTDLSADSLGSYVRTRFGHQVHERLVDPLIGSIYATDTDRHSLQAVPQIADLANNNRSVVLGARHLPAAQHGPVFCAPVSGLGQFIDAIAARCATLGVTISTGTAAQVIEPVAGGWLVDGIAADGVVLTCPAARTAALLRDVQPDAAQMARGFETADVVIVTLAVDATAWPAALRGHSGYLVARSAQRLVTAVSFGSQKWAHWHDGRREVLRVSLGRDGLPTLHLTDDELVAAALDEVGAHLGINLAPTHVRVTRWAGAFPQYRPHHGARVTALQACLPGGVALAGASYHGVGIPACISSAQTAADAQLVRLRAMAQ